METAKITYLGNLRTESVHNKSKQVVITDAPLDNHGKGEAFSPTDLLASSLGSCMITIMGITANNHQINLETVDATVTKIMESDPRRVSEIVVEITLSGNFTEKEKKLLENAATTCPVAKSLHADLKQTVRFNY